MYHHWCCLRSMRSWSPFLTTRRPVVVSGELFSVGFSFYFGDTRHDSLPSQSTSRFQQSSTLTEPFPDRRTNVARCSVRPSSDRDSPLLPPSLPQPQSKRTKRAVSLAGREQVLRCALFLHHFRVSSGCFALSFAASAPPDGASDGGLLLSLVGCEWMWLSHPSMASPPKPQSAGWVLVTVRGCSRLQCPQGWLGPW
ncbi:hypothetical protein BGZ60DRAFT_26161 [Tricladium varicosporioides]|nr:hypothetical protein BGZ60DRAFT_26161 [Hymenoscyphus varicosporioides]